MRARETKGKSGWKYAPQISPKRATPSHCLHSRRPVLVSGMRRGVEDRYERLSACAFPPPSARCSLGPNVFIYHIPFLAPIFPHSHSDLASEHVMDANVRDGFPVQFMRAPRLVFAEGGRWMGRLDVYTRGRVRAGITQLCPPTRATRRSGAEDSSSRLRRGLAPSPPLLSLSSPAPGHVPGVNARQQLLLLLQPTPLRVAFRARGAHALQT
jgi:hypothetical protein